MAIGFPLLIDLNGNNCTVFGGGKSALRRVKELLRFGAKVTLVSPQICPELAKLSDDGVIRHIPRKYFRGDCSNAQLCVAATDNSALNIAISSECKNKSIPVNVTQPRSYGTFAFPRMVLADDVVLSINGSLPAETLSRLRDRLQRDLPDILNELTTETE